MKQDHIYRMENADKSTSIFYLNEKNQVIQVVPDGAGYKQVSKGEAGYKEDINNRVGEQQDNSYELYTGANGSYFMRVCKTGPEADSGTEGVEGLTNDVFKARAEQDRALNPELDSSISQAQEGQTLFDNLADEKFEKMKKAKDESELADQFYKQFTKEWKLDEGKKKWAQNATDYDETNLKEIAKYYAQAVRNQEGYGTKKNVQNYMAKYNEVIKNGEVPCLT